MEAAHVIPLSLNNFDSSTISGLEIVRDVRFFLDTLPDMWVQRDAARTWDMIQSWTQIGHQGACWIEYQLSCKCSLYDK